MNTGLIKRFTDTLNGEILHATEMAGTVCVVEQRGDERWYHAREFTKIGRRWEEAGGYSTKDKYHYMGERYRSRALWGDYLGEVYRL